MATYYWVGGTGTWSATGNTQFATSSGGAPTASNPTSADTVIFDSASGTGTCTTSAGAAAAIVTLNSSTLGLTLGANLTNSGTFTLTLGALNLANNKLSCQIFSSNNSNTRSVAFGTGGITVTGNAATILAMATATGFTYTGTPTINATYSGSTGTRVIQFGVTAGGSESNALNINVSAGADTVTIGGGGAYKSIDFTGFSGSLSSTASSIFIYGSLKIGSGMTITASAGPLNFVATSGTQQITTNSVTVDRPFVFNGVGATFAFQGALTQGSTRAFTITNGTVQLKNGVTSTVGAFATAGTNVKYLQSTTAGSSATLSQASGTVNASYLNIKDIAATGGATFNALWANNNVDAGDNSGWVFGDPPVIDAVEYTYALRSLTEPRRF